MGRQCRRINSENQASLKGRPGRRQPAGSGWSKGGRSPCRPISFLTGARPSGQDAGVGVAGVEAEAAARRGRRRSVRPHPQRDVGSRPAAAGSVAPWSWMVANSRVTASKRSPSWDAGRVLQVAPVTPAVGQGLELARPGRSSRAPATWTVRLGWACDGGHGLGRAAAVRLPAGPRRRARRWWWPRSW